jgi:hypothetical protein
MRETRSSGSVEGVMGNHDSYSDSFSPRPRTISFTNLSLQLSAFCSGRVRFSRLMADR